MKFEIDDIKRKAIASQVFSKTALLKHIDPNIDGNFKTSFAFLNAMYDRRTEPKTSHAGVGIACQS